MKLGSREEAELIYRRRKSGLGPLPKGWSKVGEGAYRSSYLSPGRVVYKICHDYDYDCNDREYNAYIRSHTINLPKDWGVAPTILYKLDEVSVIAMKYIEGVKLKIKPNEDDEAILESVDAFNAFSALGLYDVHEGNFIITPKGKKIIIDLGE
jgi:hypothetical protein